MIQVRRSGDRGRFDHGWLDTRHTFSFGSYFDPAYTGFRSLRVLNEDRVVPNAGFPTHGHREMEIISYVIKGQLEHRDSLGHGAILGPGEIQRMTAGTGIRHSEFNPSTTEPVHFLQIWIEPGEPELTPSYQQEFLPWGDQENDGLIHAAGPPGSKSVVDIHQNANLWIGRANSSRRFQIATDPGRFGWIQVIKGSIKLNGMALEGGDGASTSNLDQIDIESNSSTEYLYFDLA